MNVHITVTLPAKPIEVPTIADAYEVLQAYVADVIYSVPFTPADNASLQVAAAIPSVNQDGSVAGSISGVLEFPPVAEPVQVVPLNSVQE